MVFRVLRMRGAASPRRGKFGCRKNANVLAGAVVAVGIGKGVSVGVTVAVAVGRGVAVTVAV